MAPYSNLPKLLRPIYQPHHPDHHDHTGHSHPYPRPSLYITSIAMALLSTYVLLLVGLAIFTMWRVSRKHSQLDGMAGTTRNDAALRLQQKGMAKSRAVVREVDGSGSGSWRGIPNTHLSHEDLDDTEETALLGSGGHTNQSYGIAESREPESYRDSNDEDVSRNSERREEEGVEADDEFFTVEGGRRVVPRYDGQRNSGKSKGESRTMFGIENQSPRELASKDKMVEVM